MHPWVEKLVRQVQTTPPKCLAGFRLAPLTADPWRDWAGWSLACGCGSRTGRVLGYPLRNHAPDYTGPELFLSPLAFECAVCGAVTEIIDTAAHGYDAECARLGGGEVVTRRGSGERAAFACPGCGTAAFEVTASFAHPHFDLIEDEPELEPRAQDFFDAFDCRARCVSCGQETSVANYELA